MQRAVLVAVLIAATPAHGSPIERLWEADQGCTRGSLVEWGDLLVTRSGDELATFDRATGKRGAPIPLHPPPEVGAVEPGWGGTVWASFAVGDLLVLRATGWFAVIDRTGKLRWHAARPADAGGDPYLHAFAGDLVVAHPQRDDEGIHLERRDGSTGAVKWRAQTAAGGGQIVWLLDDGSQVYTFASPGYYSDHVTVTAFDLATGARRWQADLATGQPAGQRTPYPPQQFAAVGGKLFAALPPEGVRVYDGATGAQSALAVADVSLTDIVLPGGAIAARGRRIYVVRTTGVSALDAPTKRLLWTADLRGGSLVAATEGTVYAIDDAEVLHALDARTGARTASYGVADRFGAYATPDDRGPVYVTCKDDRLVALGPSVIVEPPEHATITGKLLCRRCTRHGGPKPLANVVVAAGGATTRTDASGAFALAVAGRGALRVTFDLGSAAPGVSWSDVRQLVVLRGKQRYALGSIGARRFGGD